MTTSDEKAVVTDNFETELREILISNAGLLASSLEDGENDSLAELGLDSLATMELQAIVKARHGVLLPDESLTMSVQEISAFMRAELGKEN